jgi:hypothetical protein
VSKPEGASKASRAASSPKKKKKTLVVYAPLSWHNLAETPSVRPLLSGGQSSPPSPGHYKSPLSDHFCGPCTLRVACMARWNALPSRGLGKRLRYPGGVWLSSVWLGVSTKLRGRRRRRRRRREKRKYAIHNWEKKKKNMNGVGKKKKSSPLFDNVPRCGPAEPRFGNSLSPTPRAQRCLPQTSLPKFVHQNHHPSCKTTTTAFMLLCACLFRLFICLNSTVV